MENIVYNQMTESRYFENTNCSDITDIVVVSAFFDIGRESWNAHVTTTQQYINAFNKQVAFQRKMIVFMDDRYISEIIPHCKPNTIIIPININWLMSNSDSWKNIERAKQIMSSPTFISLIEDRINAEIPECLYAEYNIVNHSKLDYIKYAIENNYIEKHELICWCDFGYYGRVFNNNSDNYPISELDLNKFNLHKLNFCLRNRLIINDCDTLFTLIVAREVFTGGFFAGTSEKMLELHTLYHECLMDLYNNNISDDDQHVFLKCFLTRPDMFELFLSETEWPRGPNYFQK